jgi:ABC-type Co2+ transport system permease subunit
MDFNFREIMKRVLKYLVEAIVVALACYAIPKKKLDLEEVALIALVAAATFSILDTYMPRV